MQNGESMLVQCIRGAGLHCRTGKASLCNAYAERDCIAEAGKQAGAMHTRSGIALRNGESKQEQCSRGAGLHCGTGKVSRSNAFAERDCIAEAGKQAGAMQPRNGIALRNGESKLVQCIRGAGLHCGTGKASLCNAAAERGCIAEPGKQAGAMHSWNGIALRKRENKQEQCIRGAGLHCRMGKVSRSNAAAERGCIAEPRKQAGAMHSWNGIALRNWESKLVQCIRGAGFHLSCRVLL